MKISKIITEQSFSKYEQFEDALMQAKEQNSYREFESILKSTIQKKQYDWFCRYLQRVNPSNQVFKEMFKQATPF